MDSPRVNTLIVTKYDSTDDCADGLSKRLGDNLAALLIGDTTIRTAIESKLGRIVGPTCWVE